MMRKRNEPAKGSSDHPHIDTLIGPNSSFTGELVFEGAVRIDGNFEGNIRASHDGTLIVSQDAKVSGEVHVPNLILHGLIKGNVHASKSLKVGEKGCINGDVEYWLITLAEGASINGRCSRIAEKATQTSITIPSKEGSPVTA